MTGNYCYRHNLICNGRHRPRCGMASISVECRSQTVASTFNRQSRRSSDNELLLTPATISTGTNECSSRMNGNRASLASDGRRKLEMGVEYGQLNRDWQRCCRVSTLYTIHNTLTSPHHHFCPMQLLLRVIFVW